MILLFNLREFDRKALLDNRIHRGIAISVIVIVFRTFPQCGELVNPHQSLKISFSISVQSPNL